MKNLFSILCTTILCVATSLNAQIDIQPNAIAINDCNPLSELTINSVGDTKNTIHIVSEDNVNGSAAVYAKAYDITGFGDTSYAILGDANFTAFPSFAYGVIGSSIRSTASNEGRSFGVRGNAGNATPGANFGVFGDLQGTNAGAAVVGFDRLTNSGWNQVLPSNCSYAGYFRGKGYFHDNVGLGEDDPKEKLHVNGGNIYIYIYREAQMV